MQQRGSTGGLGSPLARGSRSIIHAWGRDAVAKVPLASTPEGWIEYEARYTDAVHASGAPAPRLLGMEVVGGRTVSVYERVRGRPMWERVVARPTDRGALARLLAELQVHLTTIVPPVSLPLLSELLVCKITRAARRVDPSLDVALGALPTSGATQLCHGDLHPGNVLITAAGPVIVDWFDVARGDALYDVARTTVLLSPGLDHPPPAHLAGLDPAVVDAVRAAYLAAIGDLLAPPADALAQWEAVASVARLAEGVAADGLLATWRAWRTHAVAG